MGLGGKVMSRVSMLYGRLKKRNGKGEHILLGGPEAFVKLDGKIYRVSSIKSLPSIPDQLVHHGVDKKVAAYPLGRDVL